MSETTTESVFTAGRTDVIQRISKHIIPPLAQQRKSVDMAVANSGAIYISTPEVKEAFETAKKLKEEGNTLYKEGKYEAAIKTYGKVALYILLPSYEHPPEMAGKSSDKKIDPPVLIPEQKESLELRVVTFTNIATCYLKLSKYSKAFEYANKALLLDPLNSRALWRRGQVHIARQEWDDAERDIGAAASAFEGDKAFIADVKVIEEHSKQYDEKKRAHWSGMFGAATAGTSASSTSTGVPATTVTIPVPETAPRT